MESPKKEEVALTRPSKTFPRATICSKLAQQTCSQNSKPIVSAKNASMDRVASQVQPLQELTLII